MNKIIVGVLLVLLISTVYASDLKREFIPEDLTVSPGGDFTIRFIPDHQVLPFCNTFRE